MSPIYAIRPTATGDISLKDGETSNAHIAWSYPRDGAYMQTPILYGDILYVCRDNGVLSAFDAKTGKRHYQARLGTGRRGSRPRPVAAAGRIYYTSEDGDVYRREGRAGLRAAGHEPARRSRDGHAGDFGECADLPHARTPAVDRRVNVGHLPLAFPFSLYSFLFFSHSSLSPSNHAIGPSAA